MVLGAPLVSGTDNFDTGNWQELLWHSGHMFLRTRTWKLSLFSFRLFSMLFCPFLSKVALFLAQWSLV